MKLAPVKTLTISSTAFAKHGKIPDRYSAYHEGVSPALAWSGVPEGTKSLALIVNDPDAPRPEPFVHWVAYGIDPAKGGLAEGEEAAHEGTNSAGEKGYMGPKPPPGHGPHHYFFWLYALDAHLDLPEGLSREELVKEIAPHVIEQERLIGTYEQGR